jgi:predicted dehydrogenase
MQQSKTASSRRGFMAAAIAGFPVIVPAHVLGKNAPSNRIQIGQIGCGRIARTHDIKETIRHTDRARFVAVCDLDSVRLADGKQMVEEYYKTKLGTSGSVKTYSNYKDLLADKSIDAVIISTPDHWHAQPAIEAALAGKDIYLQKPASLTIKEGRQMADVVKRSGRIFQQGSQQRSEPFFRKACELIRNGHLGKIREILIGMPEDPAGPADPVMPVPSSLNYDAWLGSTPLAPYTEKRVHPQSPDMKVRYDRPGWLRCEQFGAGMITGWGAHHIDFAQWAMELDLSGPLEVVGDARYPKSGVWDVHGPYHVRMKYANGAIAYLSEKYRTGLTFMGESGWLFVTRGSIEASDARLVKAGFNVGAKRVHLSPQDDHHLDWLEAMRTRQAPATSVEIGHRSCSACLVAHIAMKLGRTLKWDPATERFENDAEANSMLSRKQRAPYGTDAVVAKL